MQERLQKVISQWGLASRRQAEQLILEGRVRVNGAIASLGLKADPAIDAIEVDGQPLAVQEKPKLTYLLLNKPAGVVSTCDDPQGRRTVLDLLPQIWQVPGLHPVGRLDFNSTGALILTNDGHFTNQLTHPRHSIAKTYRVRVQGSPAPETLRAWRQGVNLEGRLTRPAEVRVVRAESSDSTLLEIVLREGRNRQIRKVADQLGHPVLSLHRTAIGAIQLCHLSLERVRPLSSQEVITLIASSASPKVQKTGQQKPSADVVRCH
ncbi:pseudouridine synthase [Pseudanabaena sp. FACHB-2040]|uniref:pseudouridine synthase n=1 Tax=Pseudanabaena sp. FACHB-2040 TaxID=2692859 RepID=UPI001683E290|nr:pseudouridine synthase [Pseudanabaena sp. FACHB-2040]MBD0267565.1 rRNA pseudouridine synthase [Cyanobacteria bacterium Co-bin8]MBD2259992.1 rRNA pseudouridine synthase [Pseudanabaena sp. FACHB-2040]